MSVNCFDTELLKKSDHQFFILQVPLDHTENWGGVSLVCGNRN